MPLPAPEYWLEWTKNYFSCQFTHMGGIIHKKNVPESTPLWFVAFWKFNKALGGLTTAISIFVNSTDITTNIETAALSTLGNWNGWIWISCACWQAFKNVCVEIVYFQYLLVGSSQCQRLEDLAIGGWSSIWRVLLVCLALTPCYRQIVQTWGP